jgi:hypothetical protein
MIAPIAIWTFFEGFWFVVILALLLLAWQRKFFILLITLIQIIGMTMVALSVDDVTRSGAYLVPLVFVSILLLKNNLSQYQMRKALLFCAFVSFIFPAYYVLLQLSLQSPIYYEGLHYILNKVGHLNP